MKATTLHQHDYAGGQREDGYVRCQHIIAGGVSRRCDACRGTGWRPDSCPACGAVDPCAIGCGVEGCEQRDCECHDGCSDGSAS